MRGISYPPASQLILLTVKLKAALAPAFLLLKPGPATYPFFIKNQESQPGVCVLVSQPFGASPLLACLLHSPTAQDHPAQTLS